MVELRACGERAEAKLVDPRIAAFVREARLRHSGPCHSGKATPQRSGESSVSSELQDFAAQ